MQPFLNRFLSGGQPAKILLLRHGQIRRDGPAKRFIGQSDPPLSDIGRDQARYWADQFSGLPVDRIVASDLQRCVQTARILAERLGLPVAAQAALREINLGRWENLTFARVAAEWPDAFAERGRDPAGFRPPGGESFTALQRRVVAAFEEAVHVPGHSLIVAHAGVNRVLLCHLLGMPLANLFHLAQDDGALNLIADHGDRFRVHAVNLPPGESSVIPSPAR